MSKTKLIILSAGILIVVIISTVAVLYFAKESTQQNANQTDTSNQTPSDPVTLEKEAESVLTTNPEEASEKYNEASKLYEAEGNTEKAFETAANGAAAEATPDNILTAAPPLESSVQP